MIVIEITCDLCGRVKKWLSAQGDQVNAPKGWVTRGKVTTSFKEHYGETLPASNWCSMEHRTAHLEAEDVAIKIATLEGREKAREVFAVELKKLCLAAHSAVEALGNVVKDS